MKTDIRHPGTARTRSYGVDATSTLSQRLGWDIHAFIRKPERAAEPRCGIRGATGLRCTAVAPGTGSAGRSYGMDAAFMSLQLPGSGNHAVRVRSESREPGAAPPQGRVRRVIAPAYRSDPSRFAVTEYRAPDNTIRADDACAIFSCHAHLDGVPKVSRMFR